MAFTEDPDEPEIVLGVFATAEEADAFGERVSGRFQHGVTLGHFAMGWAYDKGASGYDA